MPLLRLSRVSRSGDTVPAGRSYDGNDWEGVEPDTLAFACEASRGACAARLAGKGKYVLRVYTDTQRGLSNESLAARFLSKARAAHCSNRLELCTLRRKGDSRILTCLLHRGDRQNPRRPSAPHGPRSRR